MFLVFVCRECGHRMYVEKDVALGQKLQTLLDMPCPGCGEARDALWGLDRVEEKFPGDG